MPENWNRHFEVQIADSNGKGISLSDFKVVFDIKRNDNQWPATATVTIYNLAPETKRRIMQREYSRITLIAGYDGLQRSPPAVVPASEVGRVREIAAGDVNNPDGANFGVIFSGDIAFTVEGKENITDHYLVIQAADGDKAFREATINASLAKGYTLRDEYELLMKYLAPYGIQKGVEPVFPDTVYPRAASYYGRVSDYLSRLAEDVQATWQFSFGKVDFIQKDMARQQTVILHADNGLVGTPQRTLNGGVNVKCLINGFIHLHGLIQLDQASVFYDSKDQALAAEARQAPGDTDTDGLYIVRYISYRGDTRGVNWYMELACDTWRVHGDNQTR